MRDEISITKWFPGRVYSDINSDGAPNMRFAPVSEAQAVEIERGLIDMIIEGAATDAPYRPYLVPYGDTCRSFSQDLFRDLLATYGLDEGVPPSPRTEPGLQSISDVPSISAVTTTEAVPVMPFNSE